MSQRGAAVVEFAIVVPLLLLFFFGIIEFSLLMYNKQVMTNASREAARYGIVQKSPRRAIGEIQDVVIEWAKPRLITFGADILEKNDEDISVTACYAETNTLDCSAPGNWVGSVPGANFGDKLKVRIRYNYDFLLVPKIPILGTENNFGTIILNAETVMNYE